MLTRFSCLQLRDQAVAARDWVDATGRPTVGDFVRLKVSKEGLSPGDICEVTHDDRDENPYKLKKVGTSSVKSYFDEAMVQKVVLGGGGISSRGRLPAR